MTIQIKNTENYTKEEIVKQLNEPRPLPMGRQEFDEWSDRIIAGAVIPGVDVKSQKFALADLLMHLGPTESHKADGFFIHSLRKFCVNQVAHSMKVELKAERDAKLAAEEAEKKVAEGDTGATVHNIGEAKVETQEVTLIQ